jgi:hypothetical protein
MEGWPKIFFRLDIASSNEPGEHYGFSILTFFGFAVDGAALFCKVCKRRPHQKGHLLRTGIPVVFVKLQKLGTLVLGHFWGAAKIGTTLFCRSPDVSSDPMSKFIM